MRLILFVTLAAVLHGCAVTPLPRPELPARTIELEATPFHAQSRYQCGPAALATVLQASGVEVSPEALVDQVWLPERQGSLQVELVAATRRHGRIPYPIAEAFEALAAELAANRPVLVMQNLGVALIPVWHFAVVIGIDPDREQVILRSGTTERLAMPLRAFMRTWQRADYWGMVTLQPGELPAAPDRRRYLAALADLERMDRPEAAEAGYRAWLEHHPDDSVAMFGRANSLLALGDAGAAESVYRDLLAARPEDAAVMHNLARVLLERGYRTQAETLLRQARQQPDLSPRLRQAVESSLAEVDAAPPR